MQTTDRVALITGGSSGIGKACVLKFHSKGIHVVFCDVNSIEANNVLQTLQSHKGYLNVDSEGTTHFVHADATKEEDVERVVQETLCRYGRIDYLINNVGVFSSPGHIDHVTAANLENSFRTNVVSMFLFSKKCLPHIRKVKGSIVNMSSLVVQYPCPGALAYTVSKAGVTGFTVALAVDEAQHGVRVNAVAPGPTETPQLENFLSTLAKMTPGSTVETFQTTFKNNSLLKKFADPTEVAAAVLYLARDATHTTGEVLDVAGGNRFFSS